jgi:hypothetical protein
MRASPTLRYRNRRGGASGMTDEDFDTTFGLPRPRWKNIRERVFSSSDHAARHQGWCEAQRAWLKRLSGALQQPYQVLESEHFLILTAARGDAAWLTEFAEQALRQVTDLVGESREDAPVGKLAVLVFAGEAEYRRYVRHYAADGRPSLSAACFINDGDAHIAIDGLVGFKHSLVHELVHSHLSSPPRPLWLEEGLAQHLTRQLITRQRLSPGTMARQEHRSVWRQRTLATFWSGEAFKDARPHGLRAQAYELAELMVLEMASLSAPDLRAFAAAARRPDAGDAACRAVYGFALGVWARKVLGEGAWAPPPPTSAAT